MQKGKWVPIKKPNPASSGRVSDSVSGQAVQLEKLSREKELLKMLDDFKILYTNINQLIVEYNKIPEWESTAYTTWRLRDFSHGLLPHEQYIYKCGHNNTIVKWSVLNNKIIEIPLLFDRPTGMDIDISKSVLYIADYYHVTLLSLQTYTILSKWKIPRPAIKIYAYRGIKVDNNNTYLTSDGIHQIFMCNSNNGKVLNTFGTVFSGSKAGTFNYPREMAVNLNYLYICDRRNDRVQILKKETGLFIGQWGNPQNKKYLKKKEFKFPDAIYYDELENLFYIGDDFSVQIWTADFGGQCIQRIGNQNMKQFDLVSSICRINDHLYVNDFRTMQVQIFRRMF